MEVEKGLGGYRKASAKLQSALSRFKDYLNAYSGLVDIAIQADQQYGGLAYAILCQHSSLYALNEDIFRG